MHPGFTLKNVTKIFLEKRFQHIVVGDLSASFRRFFALCAIRLSCPLSVLELELSLSSSSELELDEELELLDESEAKPVLMFTLILSACLASSG